MKIKLVNGAIIEGIKNLVSQDHVTEGHIFIIYFISGGISFVPVKDIKEITV